MSHQVDLDTEQVQGLSILLMEQLESWGVDRPTAMASIALALGRLVSARMLTDREEITFVQDIMDWSSAYWPQGSV